MNTTSISPINNSDFFCKDCNYSTCNKRDYKKHNNTNKHKKHTDSTEKSQKNPVSFKCNNCNKEYKHHSSLWKHKKKCFIKEESKDLVEYLIKENTELKKKILDLCILIKLKELKET